MSERTKAPQAVKIGTLKDLPVRDAASVTGGGKKKSTSQEQFLTFNFEQVYVS